MASKIAAITIPKTMRAWTHHRTGAPSKTLSLKQDVAIPSLPTDSSVLVRVSHVAFHPGILMLMHFIPSWMRRMPAIPETDFSGIIVSCGKNVPGSSHAGPESELGPREFRVGSLVFGSLPVGTYLSKGHGALAEYIAIDTAAIAKKPSNLTFSEASGLGVSAHTAVVLVETAEDKLSKAKNILINSPCGGVGHFATQLIRHRNPDAQIIGICSGRNHELAVQLGCTDTVDHTAFPDAQGKTLTDHLAARYGDEKERFDLIFDAYGSQDLWTCSASYLKAGNDHPYINVGPKQGFSVTEVPGFLYKVIKNSTLPPWLGGVPRPYKQISAFSNTEALEKCRELAEKGEFKTHVGETWEMDQALSAYETIAGGHARGKVIVKVWKPEEES